MKTLRIILWDHLSHTISSLYDCNKAKDIILMCEVHQEATYVSHHKKKLAFLFSAMRHFAKELEEKNYSVSYTQINDKNNSGSIKGEVKRLLKKHSIDSIVITHPGEYRILQDILSWEKTFGIPVKILPDDRFLCSMEEFNQWAKGRKQLVMEYFYREMRKKYNLLMDHHEPLGGQWNYDSLNRKAPEKNLDIPPAYYSKPDSITLEVIDQISQYFPNHFGDLEPFYFAVTRKQALIALKQFIEERLPFFGDYQDAMIQNEPWMYHSHLSFYINSGLLLPLECLHAAQKAYHEKKAPINAVEGFIRQILGWREYVRGIYWLKMPGYKEENFLNAQRNLPEFYWTGKTKINCLRQCVLETKHNAYAHHIQRLMVLGNFALIAGISPAQVNEWFLIVYADAYEWVELPNVSGMILFADGGYLGSKPYAAGGTYINKMSNYCTHCSYKVSQKNGPSACPFNYLYWDFLSRNREKLSSNHRIGMMYTTYDRMESSKKEAIASDSARFLKMLESNETV